MRWVFIECAKILLLSVAFGVIAQNNVQAWSMERQPEYTVTEAKSDNALPCTGIFSTVILQNEQQVEACVMGVNTKVASYYSSDGEVGYAISFPFDSTYYPLDVCIGIWGCVYSQENDTFIGLFRQDQSLKKAIIYSNFVQHLNKFTLNGFTQFFPSESSKTFSVADIEEVILSAESVAVSKNGKWGLVEVRDYGVLRVNIETSEVRRVSAPGIIYGSSSNPRVEMAISDDGKTVVTMGLGKGAVLYTVDELCGDVPSTTMVRYFSDTSTPCTSLRIVTSNFISSFYYAAKPKFNYNDSNLSFDIYGYFQTPRHVTLFSEENASQNNIHYLAIGDSFTSGEGEVKDSFYIGGEANKCHVSTRSYPYLLATQWDISGHNAACSGATIETARGQKISEYQKSQVSEVEARLPRLLSVGIGANDAGFMGKLKSCVGIDTCEWAKTAEKRQSTAMEIKNLYAPLKHFYEELKTKTPGKIIAIGYPKIILDGTSCAVDIGIMFNQVERQFMNEGIHYLNQVIKAAASDSQIEYADVENAFTGSELCSEGSFLSMNSIRFGGEVAPLGSLPNFKIIGAESFHPTPTGQTNLASAIRQLFPYYAIPEHCVTCVVSAGAPQPNSYWTENVSNNAGQQRAVPFLRKITFNDGEPFEISIPAFSFEPESDIKIELHSEAKQINILKSAPDGSFVTTVWLQDFEPGFHSLHAIGKNYAGETVDIYDFLTLKGTVQDENIVVTHSTNETNILPKVLSVNQLVTVDIFEPSGVLGIGTQASLVNLAVNNEVSTVERAVQKPSYIPSRTPAHHSSGHLIVLGLSGLCVVLGVLVLIYYWKKRSRNPG